MGWRLTWIKYHVFSILALGVFSTSRVLSAALFGSRHLSGWGILHAIVFLSKSSGGGLKIGSLKKAPYINH